jgi:hypothetical protein
VIARLLDALALPATARMTPRGVKRELTSNMVGPRADKQLLETKLASVEVAGVLRPNELGIAAYTGDGRDYAEIVVLAAKLQDADRRARIEELLHRAVHNPVVLLLEAADASWLSLAHKRPAPATAAGVALDHVDTTQIEPTCPTGDAFLDSLTFRRQPMANLFAVYEGWINCVLAAQVAALTGIYRLAAAGARRAVLANHRRLHGELERLRTEATRTPQIARRVELNLAIKQVEAELRTHIELLSRTPAT